MYKLNIHLINIIQSYNLPSLEIVKNINNINKENLQYETCTIHNRLTENDCYDEHGEEYYTDLLNTRIVRTENIIGYKYWTIKKIKY